jgi:hypothetical protein
MKPPNTTYRDAKCIVFQGSRVSEMYATQLLAIRFGFLIDTICRVCYVNNEEEGKL